MLLLCKHYCNVRYLVLIDVVVTIATDICVSVYLDDSFHFAERKLLHTCHCLPFGRCKRLPIIIRIAALRSSIFPKKV